MTQRIILDAATTTVTGSAVQNQVKGCTVQANVSGTGSVSATVEIHVSNDAFGWMTIGTITLSGTTSASDGFAVLAPWEFVRAKVTAISGTGAAVKVMIGA